jgi:CRISPR/Cas system CSM-associated protein Csm4 (group 5 of RAMP superfamily)
VKSLKKEVGLWIDDTKAVIFSLADEGAKIKRISSESKKNVRFSDGAQKESAEEHGDKRLTEHLSNYFDEVIAYICDAESILIFGPGETKRELKKRLESRKLHQKVVGFETVDKMTDNQIVAKVRQRFLK